MNIYLVRHGETEENKNRYYYGSLDVSLNENGITQAKKAGKALKHIIFDKLYVSERIRTKETAELALGNDIAAVKDSRINEMSFGVFEGKTYEEIKKLYPKDYKCWEEDWMDFAPNGGESYRDFYNRVESFMDELIKNPCENVLVVTHGGVIRSIYCYVLNGKLDLYWKFSSKNGDISLIKYEYGNIFIDSITHI
ncbi:alpha-ribazole phosphatase [Clostridium omnivorum]|uniref:Alpha-ribazole phosphatase n=1 Tax=Clostridium omnivorum TaxID=1604902 RepID=A0ABQ5N8W5_9CLOT|nr:alpha-ribazole phosphatase [Clostridium sp. E14]GLC31480.1 alpha-ribazole phosphatase [Clostridium sp. E14]